MKGRTHRISALDRAAASSPRRRRSLFEAQLWLLALFVAMSLLAAAARSVIDGSESPAVSAVLAIAGIALFPIGWRNVAPLLERAEGARRAECAEAATAAGKLRLALQR
jgi:hypothetical protein